MLVCFIALCLSRHARASSRRRRSTTCYPVQRGDTAARIALRLTKNANNAYAPWFQILDPAASAFIPKSQYARIRPGWQACIDGSGISAGCAIGRTTRRRCAPLSSHHSRILRWWWASVLFFATALGWIAHAELSGATQGDVARARTFWNVFHSRVRASAIAATRRRIAAPFASAPAAATRLDGDIARAE